MAILDRPDMKAQGRFVLVHEMPTDILLEVVSHCNMDCIMCPQSRLTRGRGTMSFDLWKKIVDELAQKAPHIKIWPTLMGEPLLLGRRLFKYLKYAKQQGMQHVSLNTNLGVLRDDWMDDLFDARFDELVISMDGITKETYEKIRVGGKIETILKNIDTILDQKERRKAEFPKITIQYIVMDENEHEQDAFVEYWEKQNRNLKLKIKPRTGWAAAVDSWNAVDDVVKNDERIPCTWLLRQLTVFWDGRVPQCDGDWDLQYQQCGDATVQTIEEIWDGRLKELRQKHLRHEWSHEPCNSCQDWAAGTAEFLEYGPGKTSGCGSSRGPKGGQELVQLSVNGGS